MVPKLDVQISDSAKRLFARVPVTQRAIRWITDALYEFFAYVGLHHGKLLGRRLLIGAADVAKMNRFASIRDKELRRRLTPDYDFGCKRPTFSNSYYRTFTKPHVHLQTTGIDRIEPDGIVANDGTKAVIDTLVLATGFDLWEANFPAIEVVGREGRNLGKWWRDTRFQAYQGLSMPYFPNFLNLASPFAQLGLNFFNTMECHMRHMNRLFGELQRRHASTFEVTEDANAEFLDRMTGLLDVSVFYHGDCATSRSYYFDPGGEATLLRPVPTLRRSAGGVAIPVERLRIRLTRKDAACRRSSVSPAWGWPASGSHIVSSRTRSSALRRKRFPRTPSSISTWDGAAETVLGVALVARKTRKLAPAPCRPVRSARWAPRRAVCCGAGGFRCFPLCPVVRRIPLGGNASPDSLLPVAAGRFRSIACHLRRISVTWPYLRWRICCRVARDRPRRLLYSGAVRSDQDAEHGPVLGPVTHHGRRLWWSCAWSRANW